MVTEVNLEKEQKSCCPQRGATEILRSAFLHHDHHRPHDFCSFSRSLRHHRAFPSRDVARRDPIQREGQHIVAAEIATAVRREQWPQRIVCGHDVVLDEVLDHRTVRGEPALRPARGRSMAR